MEVGIEEIEEGEVVNCLSNKGMNMCSDDVLALDSVGASCLLLMGWRCLVQVRRGFLFLF